ncbi:MAG: hypothetical protein ACLTX6_02050 [Lachnospiraceae bacterium]
MAAQKNYVASSKITAGSGNSRRSGSGGSRGSQKGGCGKKSSGGKQQEIQRQYEEAVRIYENETLPAYQNRLNELNSVQIRPYSFYNQAENTYQMAFTRPGQQTRARKIQKPFRRQRRTEAMLR